MKEPSKWWGILLVSVSCVWLSTHSAREASLLGRKVLDQQESMLAHQDSIRAAIERIDVRLAEQVENQIRTLKVEQKRQSVIVDRLKRLGLSSNLEAPASSSEAPQINEANGGLGAQVMNIDNAADFYESVSEGVENFNERVLAFRQTLNNEEREIFRNRTNDALDTIIAKAELADQYSPDELIKIRESFSGDESLGFFITAVEEGVLGQMLLEAEHTGLGQISSGIEIQDLDE